MKKQAKGFTLIEIMIVVICVGIIVSMAGFAFKNVKQRHAIDTLLHEVILLKTAFQGYHEMYQTLPSVASTTLLTDAKFAAVKPFWIPFNSDTSQAFSDAKWYGKSAGGKVTVILKRTPRPQTSSNTATSASTSQTASGSSAPQYTKFTQEEIEAINKRSRNLVTMEATTDASEIQFLILDTTISD